MEEVMVSIWHAIGPMLVADDVVRLRVAASRWNKGDWCGSLGRVFFNMLTLERHKKLWHYDTDGNRVITSVRRRIPVMEGIRRDGPQLPRKEKSHDGQEEEMDLAFYGNVMLALLREDTAVTRALHTSRFGEVHLLRENSIWGFPEVLQEALYEISSGSMSPIWMTHGIKGCP